MPAVKFKLPRFRILTHRGLEPSNKWAFPESSYQAFQNHLSRGFGIEFDPNFVKDGIVVSHDASLKRLTGMDVLFSSLSLQYLSNISYLSQNGVPGRIPTLAEVLELIAESPSTINAMHLKGKYQTSENMDALVEELKNHPKSVKKLLVFDLKPESAKYLKSKIKGLHMAPSVSHPYDIERYGSVVGSTLFSVEEVLGMRDLFDWVWLDEWDTKDRNGEKRLYTAETFDTLRSAGYKISLVTPELHGTSPGLYGGESHKDAKNQETLFRSIERIIQLQPDAICTDYPEEFAEGIGKKNPPA